MMIIWKYTPCKYLMEREQTYRSVKVLAEGDQHAKDVKIAGDGVGHHHDNDDRDPIGRERGRSPCGLE